MKDHNGAVYPSLEEFQKVVEDHDRSTCKCDCCILCFAEARAEEKEAHDKGICKKYCLICSMNK